MEPPRRIAINSPSGLIAMAQPSRSNVSSRMTSPLGSVRTTTSESSPRTGLGMLAGTSPSIAASFFGSEIAFQANTDILWTVASNGVGAGIGLGMMSGTSPSITAGGHAFHMAGTGGAARLGTRDESRICCPRDSTAVAT